MPKRNLTAAFVKTARAINGKLTEYGDTKEPGLCLRVSPSGVKSWTYRYRTLSGQQRRISIGKALDISLAEARDLIVKHRANVAGGGDPANDAMKARHEATEFRNRETVKDIGDWYFKECEAGRHKPNIKNPKRQSTIDLEKLYFNNHIVPNFGKQKLSTLTRSSIQIFINDLADNQSSGAARQSRVLLHGLFAFAQRHELTDNNPVQFVSVASYEPRKRVLTNDELKTVWSILTPPVEIEGVKISNGVAYAILITMVTLQRRGEVAGMHLDEIDRDRSLWIIPGNRTKNHRTHAVPLSDMALKLIDLALATRTGDSDYVFPSPRDNDTPIKAAALTRAFGRMKNALKLGDIRIHDSRRTGATNLTGETLGFPRFTVSKVLNHSSDSGGAAAVTGIYDQNEYLPEKRRALEAWAILLQEIVSGKKATSNVITINSAKT